MQGSKSVKSFITITMVYVFSTTERPGICPPDTVVCVKDEKDECQRDIDCHSPKKCCYNTCAHRCVDPGLEQLNGNRPEDKSAVPSSFTIHTFILVCSEVNEILYSQPSTVAGALYSTRCGSLHVQTSMQ
uniref:WAP domain-containing protein n=1 Tax=Anolis carolinensis TaxID=28377 RepID=A0A803TRC4_ANOCA